MFEIEIENWRQPFIDYLQYEKLPDDLNHRIEIWRHAPRFLYFNSQLYRRSFNEIFMRCLRNDEVQGALEDVHLGVCGAHQSGPKLND